MRNTKHKLYHDKSLKRLHNALNICGVVRNHFLALSMRYYRRYGKGISFARMCKHLTKLKRREKYKHWHIPYSWALQNILNRLSQSFREMRTLKRGHPQFKSCKKHLWGKQVSDLAFGEFLLKLKHQSKKRIRSVLKIGRWIPTTKCCCVCDHHNKDLTLADRQWTCQSCETHLDRDQNAAINILKEGVASFGLGVVRPIVLFNRILGYSVDAFSPHLNSTIAFA